MTLSPETKQQLLADPRVQSKIRESGEAALNDPAVQQLLIQIAKEKGPEVASAVAGHVKEWALDPEVHAQACRYAGVALRYTGDALRYVEQGPKSARVLAFAGGVFSIVCSVLSLLSVANIVFSPAKYVLAVYLALFSVTTMIFEVNPILVGKFPVLGTYQDLIIEKAKFMSEARGRGLFYVFQGSLWLSWSSLSELFTLDLFSLLRGSCGIYMILMGIIHILIHYGKLQVVVEKGRGYASARPDDIA
mmetsp:Transcript_51506/g.137455  ORF Transcript_51506/g.137455 Transcript_51506/m.137455 type:complete len:248 (-) Transcript_51506:80-823(-)|eukprot:CAMPEP_0194537540 /NCGR_PEP_ID=MMETSP0253-20130528/76851_1 /TAXON_ID=2966 /ORGANISM="Noctiluca scintillans" /LENGTH=247 /DNA_ID=CAMNT_0039383571 /DNA_START=63 /DNA_END=806 /DNA_ORIENTATION=+